MLFDNTTYTNPNEPDRNRQLLREYSLFKNKFTNAVSTEKKAHPWWTALSSFASSFIPFGLGAIITPAANAGVQQGKAEGTRRLNDYRRRLGLPEEADKSGTGLDMSGVGWQAGQAVQSAIGASQNNEGGGGGNFIPIQMTGDNANYTPPVDMPTGGGQNTLNLPKTDYWNNAGGGASGMFTTTQNGYTIAPATMRDGGKIEGPSHENGGVGVIDAHTGKDTNIEVEGGERVINKEDWNDVLSFLKAGKHKKALSLLKDIDKRTPEQGEMADGGKFDWQNAVDYSYDAARLGLGLGNAMKPLPQYNLPPEWGNYVDKARYFSEQGILPQEKAMAKTMADMDYAAQVKDIVNASGGNAGAVLANLGTANINRWNLANQLALRDRELKQNNFDKYGNLLKEDIALKQNVFDRQLQQAQANKEMGVGLASDAISDIRNRANFDKFYGPDSTYEKLRQSLVDKGVSEADIAKRMAEYYKNPEWIKGLYLTPNLKSEVITPVSGTTPVVNTATNTTTPIIPTKKQSISNNEWIDNILKFENSKGYSNFGFTKAGSPKYKTIQDAKNAYEKEYLPMVQDLPYPLQAVAGDFAFNSENPKASLLVASGIITPAEKVGLYSKGKLDLDKVNDLWNKNKDAVIKLYEKDPKAFLDLFDAERIRSYTNTKGASTFLPEWKERVAESRKIADKILANQ